MSYLRSKSEPAQNLSKRLSSRRYRLIASRLGRKFVLLPQALNFGASAGRTKKYGRPNMGKSTLKTFAIAIGTAGVFALGLATPSLASGATSAAKKVAGPVEQTDVRGHHRNRVSRDARNQDINTTGSTEFSSSARTSSHAPKWK